MAIWGCPNFCYCEHCCNEHDHMCIWIHKCTGTLNNIIKTNFWGLLWVEHSAKVLICVTNLILTLCSFYYDPNTTSEETVPKRV